MITVALIGIGNISFNFDHDIKTNTVLSHAKALYKDTRFHLKYCVDIDTKNEENIKKLFPSIYFYTKIETLIDKNDIDVVVIATPTKTHFDILEKIGENHNIKYFLIEKPLFSDAQSFDNLNNSLKDKIIVNYIRLFEPNIQVIKEKIEAKEYKGIQKIVLNYTKGVKNSGSHFISLVNFLFNNPSIDNIQVLRKQPGLENDPTLDLVAFVNINKQKIPLYMTGVDHTKYFLFDIDLYFENCKLHIEDTTQNITFSKAMPDETYPEYTTLKHLQDIKLNYDIIMQFPYNYICDLIKHKIEPIDFVKHEKSNILFYKKLEQQGI